MSSLKFVLSKFDETIKAPFLGDVDFPIPGRFVVDVPDGVQLAIPVVDYADLKLKKRNGILSLHPTFPNIIYDELDNAVNINLAAPDHWASVGKYEIMIPASSASNGRITTNAFAIGSPPTYMLMYWAVFRYTRSLPDYGGTEIEYVEGKPTDLVVEVSANNGVNWDTVTYATNWTPTVGGTQIVARFTNVGANDQYINYFAILYRT